jgi:hypothetical protein
VHLPDFARTTTFRWTLAVAGAFVLYTVVLFGFVYWQTAAYLLSENDLLLTEEMRVFAANTPEQRLAEIDDRLRKDPRRIKIAGLFDADGHRIAGNIESLPPRLAPDVPTDAVVGRPRRRRPRDAESAARRASVAGRRSSCDRPGHRGDRGDRRDRRSIR